jgi:hypothetical protein
MMNVFLFKIRQDACKLVIGRRLLTSRAIRLIKTNNRDFIRDHLSCK